MKALVSICVTAFCLLAANALEPLPPEAVAAIIKHQSSKVQRTLLTKEANEKMRERGLIEGEIVWSARYKLMDDQHGLALMTLVKKGTQKRMLGLYMTFDYAETLEKCRIKPLPGMHYTRLKDGKEFVVYTGGVGPGKSTLYTMINLNEEFDLILGFSEQSQWAAIDNNLEGRITAFVEAINRYYAK